MNRRQFIKTLAGGAVAAGLSGCSDTTAEETASRPAWGSAPESVQHLLMPEARRPDAVLEVFLMGGLNPWDTFYLVDEFGRPEDAANGKGSLWHTFQDGDSGVPNIYQSYCQGSPPLFVPFDTTGEHTINLGPWLFELREREDILKRMRIIVMRHAFEPHEVASPLALCGHTRGERRMAATGTHIQRHFHELAGYRPEPYAYTLFSGDSEIEAQFDINSASASGLHPASARPLALRLAEDNTRLGEALRREGMAGWATQSDALVDRYVSRYREKLRIPGTDLHHAAAVLDDLASARRTMGQGDAIAAMLPTELLNKVEQSVACGSQSALDTTSMGMNLATWLLTHPNQPARYVNYIDSGLINATGAGYDTHDYHVIESSRNVVHMTRKLKASINQPGENNPNKLDLDRHLVLLSTEFGRTPTAELGKPLGLNHWPFGYVVVAIGGPVPETSDSEPRVYGRIGADGIATDYTTPAELRAALLLAQGIWPFSNQSFAIGDVRGANSEAEAATLLMKRVWGIEVG